jgi:hypothetical protein
MKMTLCIAALNGAEALRPRGWTGRAGAILGVLMISLGLQPAPAVGQMIDWIAGTGSWSTASNWSPQNVPDAAGESARFPAGGGSYTTTLNISPTLDAVDISNATTTLNLGSQTLTALLSPGISNYGIVSANSGTGTVAGVIANAPGGIFRCPGGRILQLAGPAVGNDGQFLVNSDGTSANARLTLSSSVEFSGAGEIVLLSATSVADAEISCSAGATLTNALGHTIRGTGTVSGPVVNYGRVAGGGTAYGLTLAGDNKTNHSVIETLPGGLVTLSTGIDQSAGGWIRATDGTVRLAAGAVVTGGTLGASGSGAFVCSAGSPNLVDVTNEGPIDIQSGVSVLAGGSTFTNNGRVRVNSAGASGNTYLYLGNELTLQGSGEIAMAISTDQADANLDAPPSAWSTHTAGHTICGAGTVSASMNNQGTMRADVSGKRLLLNMPGLMNDGLLTATAGGILDLACDSVMQSGAGTILADGGTARLSGPASITGGSMQSSSGSQIQTYSGTVTVADIRNSGDWRLKPASITDLRGAGIVNDGTITVNEGTSSNTYLRAMEPVVLSGAGAVVLQCGGSADDATFSSGAGVSFVNAAGHTVRGAGRLDAGVINEGIILGDLGGVGLVLSGADKTNRNLLRAAPGGKLTIESATILQEGVGRIVADDGQALLSSGAVHGGVFQTSGAGYVRSSGTSSLRDVTNQGEFLMAPGYVLAITGDSLRNDGVIRVNDTGASGNCSMQAQQNMTLTGGGEVVLRTAGASADASVSTAAGATLTVAPEQEIRGEGSIFARMINRGTITGDVAGRGLYLADDGQTNEGTMRAIAGGLLRVYSGTVLNYALIEAADTSRVSVSGGTLDNRADVVARDGSTFEVEGGVFANHALARAHAGGRIFQSNGTIHNYGTLRAETQGEVRIDQTIAFRNYGAVEATEGGLFWCDRWADHFSGGTLTGGAWRSINTGQLRMIGVSVQTLDAEVVLDGPDSRIYSDEGITDALAGMTAIGSGGTFELRGGRDYTRGGNLTSAGRIRVAPESDLTVGGRLRQSIDAAVCSIDGTLTSPDTLRFDWGFLRGNGRVIGNVHNQGTVQPGASVGRLTIQGDYRQRMRGAIAFELGGTDVDASDLLEITGAADLGGGISLRTVNGYEPSEGDTIEVMRFASRTGAFTQLDICAAPGVCAELLWSDTSLRIVLHLLPTSDVQEPDAPQEPLEPEISEPVADQPPALPTEFALMAASSIDGGSRIELALPAACDGQVALFDVTGRRIRLLDRGPWGPGTQTYDWQGRNDDGVRVPRGIYFAKAWLQTTEGIIVRRARIAFLR